LGRLEEAIEFYRRAIEVTPTYATAHENLADAYEGIVFVVHCLSFLSFSFFLSFFLFIDKKMYAEALSEYREALRCAPSVVDYQRSVERLELFIADSTKRGWLIGGAVLLGSVLVAVVLVRVISRKK
jgi:tetratricopeptide (TPR) repeat protein